jgi:hypothetical protein
MEQKNPVTIDEAIGSIPVNEHAAALELHNKAVNAGYTAFGNKSSKKPDFYKMEYKKLKKDDPLFILHVNGVKWSIRCKLFHLDKYVTLLNKLSEKMLTGILSSRKCRGKAKGCPAGIMFTHADKKYLLCRHGMHFRGITSGDVQAVWKLLSTESTYR